MRNWKNNIVSNKLTVKETMKKINEIGGGSFYVVDDSLKLLGSVTDGDIRRALIRGVNIDNSVSEAMKTDSVRAEKGIEDSKILEILERFKIQSLPLVDKNGILVDIFTIEKLKNQNDIQVVLMAGGMGTRLGKITENLPKPMVKIAGEPILERILKKLILQGFSQFHISVNYKAEVIEEYFKNGEALGAEISYLKENKRLGTAGALSLLKTNGNPIVVMNGDLLTHVDIGQLLNFHLNHDANVTMCTRHYEVQVPFGVIDVKDGFASSFHEKPTYHFNVNAGIYIIDPEILNLIPMDEYFDMSTLLNEALKKNDRSIACFPVVEGWIDVGREADLVQAQEIYSRDDK